MTTVVISGAAGRLGSRILALALEAEDLRVEAALVANAAEAEALSAAHPGLTVSPDPSMIRAGCVLLEAAPPQAAIPHAERAAELGAPTMIASTGFTAKAEARLTELSAQIPLLLTPNLSLGVTLLNELVRQAAAALPGYDLEVLELHHRKKRDAPSGTAWGLAKAAAAGRGLDLDKSAVLARAGETGPRGDQDIGMQSIRGGDIVGDHTVFLAGPFDRLELTHRAQSRDAFAAGAIAAARFLGREGLPPGAYTMRSVLGWDDAS